MSRRSRRNHTPAFRAKVALARKLAVTMLATERLFGGSGSPRRASRRCASALDSPWVTEVLTTPPCLPQWSEVEATVM